MSFINKIFASFFFLISIAASYEPFSSKELMSAYNSSSEIAVKTDWDVFITGSYILWQVKEKGEELGTFFPNLASNKTKPIHMDFDFNSGFKLGVCTKFDYDSWSVFLEYARLLAANKKKFQANTAGFLIPSKAYFSEAETANTNNRTSFGKTHWDLSYNITYLEIGRSCYVGTRLTFKPHIGLMGGWIEQKDNTRYIFTNLTFPPSNIEIKSISKSSSWLLGPRIGVYTNWLLGIGFKFFSNLAIALPFQEFKISFKQDNFLDQSKLNKNTKDKIGYVNSSFDINLGFGWGSYFFEKNLHFEIDASYEFRHLLNQNMLRVLIDEILRTTETKAEDLSLHGMVISFRLDF